LKGGFFGVICRIDGVLHNIPAGTHRLSADANGCLQRGLIRPTQSQARSQKLFSSQSSSFAIQVSLISAAFSIS
jgi:hypothetical protein